MCDSIFFRIAARVDQSLWCFQIAQRQAKVDARLRGGFDLREDMIAIQRDDCLARSSLRLVADIQSQF